MNTARNFYAILLSALVIVVTIVALLGVWEVLDWDNIQHYFRKSLVSLFIIFLSGVLVLFIYSVIYKSPSRIQRNQEEARSL